MEKLDLYDINGNKIERVISRGVDNPKEGEYIKLTVVYLKSGEKYLMQKVSAQKGGTYAVTGGHVSSGNTSQEQAIVEVKEELGLNLVIQKLQFLGNIYRSNAIFDVYLYEDETLKNANFELQADEVESVNWLTKEEINRLIENNLVRESSCQHYEKFIK